MRLRQQFRRISNGILISDINQQQEAFLNHQESIFGFICLPQSQNNYIAIVFTGKTVLNSVWGMNVPLRDVNLGLG
jgi:hypothetical protein